MRTHAPEGVIMVGSNIKVAYITDEIYLEHDTGMGHPESKDRLIAINRAVAAIKDHFVGKVTIGCI